MATKKATDIPEYLRHYVSDSEWRKMDPLDRAYAAAPWQSPSSYSADATSAKEAVDYFAATQDDYKPSDLNAKELQKHCWTQYKTFGPLNSAVNTKADFVSGSGFSMYSTVYEVNEYLKALCYSPANNLYEQVIGWMIRMMVEGELFVLLVFDEDGNVTIRNLEPDKIGTGSYSGKNSGLITDPEDVNQTLFYKYTTAKGADYIPDYRFILDPEYMKQRMKLIDDFKPTEISPLTKGSGKFNAIGGYRRFVIHWKSLYPVMNILRDTSSLSTTLEWINLYIAATKWELDYKRAITSWVMQIKFDDTPTGKQLALKWENLSPSQKAQHPLLRPLTPGSRIVLMPGMDMKIVNNAQLPSGSGNNQDLLNLSNSAVRMPHDIYQGTTKGATYASIKATRSPLVMEIENMQSKLMHFMKYKLLRACISANLALANGSFLSLGGEQLQMQPTYPSKWVDSMDAGQAQISDKQTSIIEHVEFTFPTVRIEMDSEAATVLYGSQHTGARGAGISDDTLAKRLGFDGLSMEKRKQAIEQSEYGNSLPLFPEGNQPSKGIPTNVNKKTGTISTDTTINNTNEDDSLEG